MRDQYVQQRARALESARGAVEVSGRVAELEALVEQWRVRAEVLGGGSSFFRGR
ncbi:hypothetical protein [Rothia sp. ZJ932]|uniref:hypothetical protein n=1 Tax=Rothia sp. ZJ932 TaxID=2810516 RepID=UPI0019677B82|nr:hypothetical protein [Rothia sp. ZJ932]QRZ60973.1 hypothetical protein JR346_06815 [Rothia sp. ZJ932]